MSSAKAGTRGAPWIKARVVLAVLAFVNIMLNAKPVMMPKATLPARSQLVRLGGCCPA